MDPWDAHYRSGQSRDWAALLLPDVPDLLAAAGARSVLDLGCGGGEGSLRLARVVERVVALDSSGEAVRLARERFSAGGISGEVLQRDLGRGLRFQDASFDAVVSSLALHYFDRAATAALFVEVRRVLRPGGLLVFTVNAREEGERRPEEVVLEPGLRRAPGGFLRRYFDRQDLEEVLFGWEVLELLPVQARDGGRVLKYAWRAAARKPASG